jgi:tRNA (guanosine-2'-O-)-methyltransferase
MRGYFGIGIFHNKTPANLGTLWRSAYQMGAEFIFTIGRRYNKQGSDTVKAWKHVPLFNFVDWNDFYAHIPQDCITVAVEMTGKEIKNFCHPERAIYLLGAEDHGIPDDIIARCQGCISLPAIRIGSYNVAVAGSLVMFDRLTKCEVATARRWE